MKKLFLIFASVLSFFPSSTFPWGLTGHRIVGEIAQHHLTPEAAAAISALTDHESLAQISNWADWVRSDPDKQHYDRFIPWHYVNIPIGQTYQASTKNPKGDIVVGLQTTESILRDSKRSENERAEALRFFVHLVGDVHQPLHVSVEEDRGGNFCMVTYFREVKNLHEVWDSVLIDSQKLSYSEYAKFLEHGGATHKTSNSQSSSYLDWVAESHAIMPTVYPENVEDNSSNSADSTSTPKTLHTYCKTNQQDKIDLRLMPDLGYEYNFKFIPVLNDRLLKAGIRLAGKLNQIFGK